MNSKSKTVTYQDYLKIPELLSLQHPLSKEAGELAHDEVLFIITHQVYELWFKLILHELDSVLELFHKDVINEQHMGAIVSRFQRIIEIQKILIEQVGVLETMSPADFLEFRDLLAPASGFQSIQFRLLEIKMGLAKERRILFEKQAFSSELSDEERSFLEETEIEQRGAQRVTFDELLQRADIISVHTPLTSDTRGLFGADAFARMKAGAVFINTARGSIHDEAALADALACDHLGGAGLDVWDVEPPQPDHRLMQMENVIATPHVAGCTSDSLHNMAEHAATQLLDIFSGKPPARPVNPEVLPKFKKRYVQILGSPH